jgi:hypothetical protein
MKMDEHGPFMDVLWMYYGCTMKKSGDFFRHIYVCLPKKLLFVFQPTDRQKSGFENQHLVINMRLLFTSLRDGNRPHRIVWQPLVTANDVGH